MFLYFFLFYLLIYLFIVPMTEHASFQMWQLQKTRFLANNKIKVIKVCDIRILEHNGQDIWANFWCAFMVFWGSTTFIHFLWAAWKFCKISFQRRNNGFGTTRGWLNDEGNFIFCKLFLGDVNPRCISFVLDCWNLFDGSNSSRWNAQRILA